MTCITGLLRNNLKRNVFLHHNSFFFDLFRLRWNFFTCTLTYKHLHTYTHTYTHIHTQTLTYIHTYWYIHTHTYTHTLTYIQIPAVHTPAYTHYTHSGNRQLVENEVRESLNNFNLKKLKFLDYWVRVRIQVGVF